MKTKITKGKWKVVHRINIESNEGYICSCGGQRGDMTPDKGMEMNEANAELIANAPETKEQRDELLKLLKKAQLSVEILINHIPTGRMRNILTEENIEILSLIKKTEK